MPRLLNWEVYGCSSTSVSLVNAEIVSMGGVFEVGVGVADKTSPRRAAIEKAQEDLRQKYEVRDKRKRELEFLLEGGDPLELVGVNAASVSVQSTSLIDQHTDQFVASETKGSFAFTPSPYGDSVESSGRLGTNLYDPNTADNLSLFDAEREFSEGHRSSLHPSRSNIVSLEKLSQTDGRRRTGEHDSAALGVPRKSYKRRYRSLPKRDGTRSSSNDVNPTRGSHGSSLPSYHGSRDVNGPITDVENRFISSNSNSKPTSPVDEALHKPGLMNSQQDIELDDIKAVELTKDPGKVLPGNATSDAIACETSLDDQCDQQSPSSAVKTRIQINSDSPQAIRAIEGITSAEIECQPGMTAIKIENKSSSCQMNDFSSNKGDGLKNDSHNNNTSCARTGMDFEPSCTQTNRSADVNRDTELCIRMRSTGSNGHIKDQTSVPDKIPTLEGDESVKEKNETVSTDGYTLLNVESSYASQIQRENGVKLQPEEELNQSESALVNELKDQIVSEGTEACRFTGSEYGRNSTDLSGEKTRLINENSCIVRPQDSTDASIPDLPVDVLLTRVSTVSTEPQMSLRSDTKLDMKIDEDSILKKAQIIEAKRKRMAELSVRTSLKQIRLKSHWDYVLEEMAWLSNDFAQERAWKIAASAQISSRAAFSCRLRKQEKTLHLEAKKVAHTLAKSVMEFWQLVEETSKILGQKSQRVDQNSVQAYAMRFCKYNNCSIVYNQDEMPLTPDRVSDMRILDPSLEDNLTEDNLFYTVLPGSMETYRSSVESHVAQFQSLKSEIVHLPDQRLRSGVLEEVQTSADFESQDNPYEEQERETHTYGMPLAFEDSKFYGLGQKKQKHSMHAYGVRSYEVCSENNGVHQSTLLAKRPGGSLDVSIPIKRVRTASRRVVSPFSAGTSGILQGPNKADASSDDTNSFQDDHSTLRGGSHAPFSLEVESAGKFEKQLLFESPEVSTRRKKKKAKHLNAGYQPRWQVDSTFQDEQYKRDQLRKTHQLESNCSSGLLAKPLAKKPKTMRQSQDNSFENIAPIGGSVPSPAASQMSNMSNPNKFIKMLGGRDRGRKPKALKMPAGQQGSGIPWTLFEDQALVVLAHDLGPHWELVSDAINSTLQFKFIFRKAKECKERHNFLMDRTSGDGADSAEDSGSSQPYPSTLPGIPKGSARQLFQRLQGPMEEDTLKSHFEKIIIIGQKQHYRKTQDPKQLQQPHSSHTLALSQVCPNNLNGGPILTPLDLCEATIPGTDILSLGYQSPHSGGLAIPNQGTVTPTHPTSGASSALQGSPSMLAGSNFPSSPSSLNSSVRDARYGLPRPASLLSEDQQRMHQCNQMRSSRSVPQPNASSPGTLPGTDRVVRMLPGGNGMGLVSGGVDRGMPMARPGFQGIASPSIVNSGSMVTPAMPPANVHSGLGPGQGSALLRPCEALQMIRPGFSQDSPRPMMSDLQMQASPGNSQMPHFGGLSSPSPPVPSYALHHPPSHPMSSTQHPPHILSNPHHPHFPGPTTTNNVPSPQQQAYTMRLAKERQQKQQHRTLQKPQQITTPNPLAPNIQSQQSQLPISSSPLQNNSQVQPQKGSPSPAAVSLPPLASVSSMKQTETQAGSVQNAPVGGSSKQRQRQNQQFLQANRQHPQQRQQQPPGKAGKGGVGRGNLINQPLVNGVSTNLGQVGPSQPSNQPLPRQKINLGPSTQRVHQMSTTHTDSNNNSNQGQPSSLIMATSSNQPKLVNQTQLGPQRVVQPNHHVNSDPPNKLQTQDSGSDHQHRTGGNPSEMDTLPQATEMDTLPQATEMDTLPQATSSATSNVARVDSEPLLNPNALDQATNLSSLVSNPSNTSEPASLASNSTQSQQPQVSPHSQQLLQAENEKLCDRSSDHRLE